MGNRPPTGPNRRRLVIQGLPKSGVSTILRALKLGEVQVAEAGFSLEVVTFKNAVFSAWTAGDLKLWKPFYFETDAVIFVVDASQDLAAAKTLLHKVLLEEALDDAKVLIFANKQDLTSVDAGELTERLELFNLVQDWHVQPCVAVNGGNGLYEGLDWLSAAVSTVPAKPVPDDDICLATPVQLLFGDKANDLIRGINRLLLR